MTPCRDADRSAGRSSFRDSREWTVIKNALILDFRVNAFARCFHTAVCSSLRPSIHSIVTLIPCSSFKTEF